MKIDTKKAFKYYCKGLNSKEIGKLLDCSYRTIQNYISTEKWKEKRFNLKQASEGKKPPQPKPRPG